MNWKGWEEMEKRDGKERIEKGKKGKSGMGKEDIEGERDKGMDGKGKGRDVMWKEGEGISKQQYIFTLMLLSVLLDVHNYNLYYQPYLWSITPASVRS